MKKFLFLAVLLAFAFRANAYHWTVNPNQYPNTMTAIAVIQIDGVEQMVNTLEVGAFCGDECRGRELPVYIEQMNRYYLFLTMYGTEGDQLTFRLYDHVLNQEFDGTCSNVESFVTNATLGSPVSPYIFEFVSATVNYTVTASANPSNGGTVSGAGTYQSGSTCTLTATANTGYTFTNWTKNGTVVSTNPTYSFTVTEDASYVANFELSGYTITATANPVEGGTVTGAGNYNYGATCTLTATANTGYNFINWTKNGRVVSTNPTYSFTVTRNASYVANFELSGYIITATANPIEGGTVTGAGSYAEGSTCTLTATANTGYEFTNWTKDGTVVSTNPAYSFTVTEDASYVANFELSGYTITATANPVEGGTVTGAGNYNYGATCTLTATANTGYEFTNWTENGTEVSTNASYTFTVTGNRNLVANFTGVSGGYYWTVNPNQYPNTMTAIAVIQIDGVEQMVNTLEVGAFCGDECRGREMPVYIEQMNRYYLFLTMYGTEGDQLTFRLYDHVLNQEFDGTCSNVESFVTNATLGSPVSPYIFQFVSATVNYTITASANPSNGGTVSGAGTYQSGSTCTLTATANTGYTFINWAKNGTVVSTNPTYSFTVTEDASYVANFELSGYTITATANPAEGGTVTGAGNYNYGATCTLTATANTGYNFINWTKNGRVVSTNPTYSFTVIRNASYVANFELSGYIITATANPIEGGTVTGAGSYTEGSTCTLTATANTGYNFTNWMKNGTMVSTNPTYSFTVTEDASYVANFELSGYTITATANPVEGGTVTGAGNYNYGATCTLTATANTGYEFTNWTENGTEVSTNASYTFTVTGNRNLVANFTGVSGGYHWTVNPNQYPNTMTAIAVIQIDGVEQMVNTLEVGAFCGDECRGREMPVYIEQMNRYYLFLTMYGTEGDQLTFRLYDHVLNQEFDGTCSNVESFVTNATLGSPVSPYIFQFVSATVNYTITASANPSNGGTVSGAGTYQSGSTCTLTATANTGYTFINWMKNGTVVSTNPTYSFTVTEDASYVANFEAEVGMPGDANGDGTVNALDIVITVNYIFGATSIEFVFENADINGDGVVNALDLVVIINLIFSKKS